MTAFSLSDAPAADDSDHEQNDHGIHSDSPHEINRDLSSFPPKESCPQGVSSCQTTVVVDTIAQQYKELGNAQFQAQNYEKAKEFYLQGLDHIASTSPPTTSTNPCGNEHVLTQVELAIRSNLAMVLLKQKDYVEAEAQCNQAIALDPSHTKVWYRRAMAREGLALMGTSAPQYQQLEQAKEDLSHCLALLSPVPISPTITTETTVSSESQPIARKQQLQQQQAAREALTRLESYPTERVSLNGSTNHHHDQTMAAAPTNMSMTEIPSLPIPPKEQRHSVLRLLMSRAIAATGIGTVAISGEALCLLEWKWWITWCRHVDFFYSNHEKNGKKAQQILNWLPQGASLPCYNKQNKPVHDDSSSDSEEDENGMIPPIDNRNLFVGDTLWEQHWYPSSSFIRKDPQSPRQYEPQHRRLKPNLVRGHHYELIPREVYYALRVWYGEVTPSIVRRVSKGGRFQLYDHDPPSVTATIVTYQTCNACHAPYAKSRCKRCLSVWYCHQMCQESHWTRHKVECNALAAAATAAMDDSINGRVLRNNSHRVGLHNLGNTCFLNAALQCLSHATPLTRHFLSNQFLVDLNTTNPLGTGGKLAQAYETVLKDLWMGCASSTSPTALKRAIAILAPRFAGCSQHDAQEFLAYLLDGLHEDLNRIRTAPYVNLPDVTEGQNMVIAGAEAWDAHRRRNDSLVMDTFYGQFRSTCICPKCDRVSVSFDAFNHVSLEIPQMQDLTRTIPIVVFRTASVTDSPTPTRYGVTIRRGAHVVDLRRALSDLCNIPAARLALCDVYNHAIYDILQDSKPVSSIRASDVLAAYEVDPYTRMSIHAVATHALVHKDTQIEVESQGLFGFPFLTSFDVELTCREVWNHCWILTKSAVGSANVSEEQMDMDMRSLLQIRIVDNRGDARPIFLDDVDISNAGVDGVDNASILPPNSDEKIMTYLGKDCAERFLFVRLEWLEMIATPEEEGKPHISPLVSKERFLTYVDHPSVLEALEKERSANTTPGVTLDQCFETFIRPERLDEHNKWYCSKCKEHVQAMKTMELWRLPNVLIVHLKRFEFKHSLRRDKLDTFVNFPLNGLDMSKHCAPSKNADSFVVDGVPAIYDLFAVTNHYGRMGFGHYTAYARRWDEEGMSNDWALFDDASVRGVGDGTGSGGTTDGVVTPAAYVLFYRRRIFN